MTANGPTGWKARACLKTGMRITAMVMDFEETEDSYKV